MVLLTPTETYGWLRAIELGNPQHGKNLDVRYVRSQGRTSEIIHSQFTNNLDDLLSGGTFYDSQ